MTLDAYASITATSSALVLRICCGPPLAVAISVPPAAPNAPKSTLVSGRFIARLIATVRIVPLAPTSAPQMISSVESISKPVIATATPVNEFSSEMTTGMSAPPIGNTKSTPSSSAPSSKREERPRRQCSERRDEPARQARESRARRWR